MFLYIWFMLKPAQKYCSTNIISLGAGGGPMGEVEYKWLGPAIEKRREVAMTFAKRCDPTLNSALIRLYFLDKSQFKGNKYI